MGIDRIGKKGPPTPPPPGDLGGPSAPKEAGRTFQVRPSTESADPTATGAARSAGGAGGAEGVAATRTALERLRAGEIDANGYLDSKVNEATAHLQKLPPAELESIRTALRERLSSDPALADLFRTATGQAAPSLRDD